MSYVLHRELIISKLYMTWCQTHDRIFFVLNFRIFQDFVPFSGFRGPHCPPALPMCICASRWGSTSMDMLKIFWYANYNIFDMSCICCVYTRHILTKIFWYANYNILICHVYGVYILDIYWLNYFDMPTKIFWYEMHMLCLYYTWYTDLNVLSGTWLSPRSW
jgi:hypothetical protein